MIIKSTARSMEIAAADGDRASRAGNSILGNEMNAAYLNAKEVAYDAHREFNRRGETDAHAALALALALAELFITRPMTAARITRRMGKTA